LLAFKLVGSQKLTSHCYVVNELQRPVNHAERSIRPPKHRFATYQKAKYVLAAVSRLNHCTRNCVWTVVKTRFRCHRVSLAVFQLPLIYSRYALPMSNVVPCGVFQVRVLSVHLISAVETLQACYRGKVHLQNWRLFVVVFSMRCLDSRVLPRVDRGI